MTEQKKKHTWKVPIVILVVLFAAVVAVIAVNHFSAGYESLNETDRTVLSELDTYFKADSEQCIWSGYTLEGKPILAINGTFGAAYLINPTEEIRSFFAQKIAMPESSSLRVYRLSALTPQLFPMRFDGNLSTIGKTYLLFDNNVYFTKYTKEVSLEPQYSSGHYITFLCHEAFHYYMQNEWADGSRFSAKLSESDIELLTGEYDVLTQIQTELFADTPQRERLLGYAKDYALIMEQRIAANPQYMNAELSMETAEGAAQYVGIKASEAVGYDYGVMYFENAKDVSFSEVIPMLRFGKIDQSFLADRMPYETGALLCELLDALQVDGWQEQLNSQTKGAPVYLHTLISNYVSRQ